MSLLSHRVECEIKLYALQWCIRWGGKSDVPRSSITNRFSHPQNHQNKTTNVFEMSSTSLIYHSNRDEPLTPTSDVSGCESSPGFYRDDARSDTSACVSSTGAGQDDSHPVPEIRKKVPYTCTSCDRCYVHKRKV